MQLLDTGVNGAEENMLLDAKLLAELSPSGAPLLHFYDWARPSLTHGYFIIPEQHLRSYPAFDRARRPTGGGIVFHTWDLAFSLLLPASHPIYALKPVESYRAINQIALQAMQSLFTITADLLPDHTPAPAPFCMTGPTQFDIRCEGKKLAGAAQRRRTNGLLHQGTLSLATPDPAILSAILLSEEAAQKIQNASYAPLGPCTTAQLTDARLALKKSLSSSFSMILNR